MTFDERVHALATEAAATRQRRMVVLAGGRGWAMAAAQRALDAASMTDALWISDAPPTGARALHGAQVRQVLGSEVDAVVFDIYAGLDVEAFGAVAGAVRAGGLFLLVSPPHDGWPGFADPEQGRVTVHPVAPACVTTRFLRRFVRQLDADPALVWVEEGAELPPAGNFKARAAVPLPPDVAGCVTGDQRAAHDAIVALAGAGESLALVLTSDRGRGKSAALGLAAATLLRAGVSRIIVTAPRFEAAAVVFAHALRHLPAARRAHDGVCYRDARLQFVAPDAIGAADPAALLLVDEAAAIPVPLLTRMLDLSAPIAFATTIHGYEGSGRGFVTRFQSVLHARRPGFRMLRLEQPVRWAEGDPLERLTFRALLLDGSPVDDRAAQHALGAGIQLARLDRDALAADERLLAAVFGLLVLAHYRTGSLDLRFLLDGPNLAVWIAHRRQQVIAAALVADEGGFEAALARAVWQGRRRPRGHLLPQSLAVHAGFEEAPTLRFQRIVRLAVHPAVQRSGVGGALLEAITGDADGAADAVGASFGASSDLLRFWAKHGFYPVRLGLTREAASGAPAVMVLRPLSEAGMALYREARARYRDGVPHLCADPVRDLEPDLIAALNQAMPGDTLRQPTSLDHRDWCELAAYLAGRRGVELVLGPLQRLLDESALAELSPEARALAEAKLRARLSWPALVQAFGFRGRNAAEEALRQALSHIILARGGGAPVRAELERILVAH